jgi:K+-transporting ATPase ATPase A chain
MIPSLPGLLQAISLFAVAILLARPLGGYIAHVMEGERVFLSPVLRPVERGIYKILRVDETIEQRWTSYAVSVLLFSFVCILALYLQERLQTVLPLSQGGIPGISPVSPDLAYNTSVSFDTNTNWQNYAGESTMTYLTQMAGLTVRNFTSAAIGVAVAIALTRGLVRRAATTIGNFWVDLTRIIIYVLLPISIVAALFLVSQGVIQTFANSAVIHTLQGAAQSIPLGPSPRRKRSRSWATTAAASSTPTPRTPSRTPRRSRTGSRCC